MWKGHISDYMISPIPVHLSHFCLSTPGFVFPPLWSWFCVVHTLVMVFIDIPLILILCCLLSTPGFVFPPLWSWFCVVYTLVLVFIDISQIMVLCCLLSSTGFVSTSLFLVLYSYLYYKFQIDCHYIYTS